MSLQEGSPIEIYHKEAAYNGFWKASVLSKESDGFWFIFENTHDETGFVYFRDFLSMWRFPFDETTSHFTFENMNMMLNNGISMMT